MDHRESSQTEVYAIGESPQRASRAGQPDRQIAGTIVMDTDQLIRTLAADNAEHARPVGFVLALSLVLWVAGRGQQRGRGMGLVMLGGLVVVAAVGVTQLPVQARARETSASAAGEPFSEARLAALRAAERPVFAYFTADWCFTCKVNERTSIETAGVRDAFAKRNVAVLVGDWTDGDPALGRFIQAHGRAGVPLYLYYAPRAAEPQLLPQVLTPGMLEALGRN